MTATPSLTANLAGSSLLPATQHDSLLATQLDDILRQRRLNALFQPILCMHSGDILGYEGLIRGPSDSPLHAPLNLFKTAHGAGRSAELETLCCRVVVERYTELNLPGKLFLNVSPESLPHQRAERDRISRYMEELGITPDQVIIELTENQPTYDYDHLRSAVRCCREMGFEIAIDDLGEGFSSLRLWSEIRPDYVKIDMHFIQGINQDPVKLQFVRSIQEIAERSNSKVIAEGIEFEAELLVIRDLGIACGQGYHIARPHATPGKVIRTDIVNSLRSGGMIQAPNKSLYSMGSVTVEKLLTHIPSVTVDHTCNQVYHLLGLEPRQDVVPVLHGQRPVGIITRSRLLDHFARPYLRELWGKRSCTAVMDNEPLIVDRGTSLQELSRIMVDGERHHLSNGCIITDGGLYVGMGSGQDLMRELTQMQINAARYANPLTFLPGNVPINEQIEKLLQDDIPFCACYVDLDHFKPFNDVYGYRKGDDIIQLCARILSSHCDLQQDFIGHIGGDDFILLFQSNDWELRCRRIMEAFSAAVSAHYTASHREQGGYVTEDRAGRRAFHPLLSISIGALKVPAGLYDSHHQIAASLTEAKRESKKINGSSLFIERRKLVTTAT